MAEKYFAKFPLIKYANNAAVNIVERAKIADSVFNNPYIWYKYDIRNFERPDQIANFYYNDQYMDWLLYMSNNIIDPYYGWYMSDDVFFAYLVKKYNLTSINQISTLQNKIVKYVNNWYSGEKISVSDYNALPTSHHRYWQPSYGPMDNIVGYVRYNADWTLNTNSIISYGVDTNLVFVKDEVVSINFVYYDITRTGKGQVLFSNSSSITINHISGYTNETLSGSSYIYGTDSGSNTVITSTTPIVNNILSGEEVYWDAVTIFDMERASNESKKSIKVLDRTFSTQISKAMTAIL